MAKIIITMEAIMEYEFYPTDYPEEMTPEKVAEMDCMEYAGDPGQFLGGAKEINFGFRIEE